LILKIEEATMRNENEMFRFSDEERLASYRALFRSELDDDAIGDIRLALTQSQPLGDDRFAERICARVGCAVPSLREGVRRQIGRPRAR
jgi:putative transposase